jgi:hypothetical protein
MNRKIENLSSQIQVLKRLLTQAKNKIKAQEINEDLMFKGRILQAAIDSGDYEMKILESSMNDIPKSIITEEFLTKFNDEI